MSVEDYDEFRPHGGSTCPACSGYLVPLGNFGKRRIDRCRNCGTTTNRDAENRYDAEWQIADDQ